MVKTYTEMRVACDLAYYVHEYFASEDASVRKHANKQCEWFLRNEGCIPGSRVLEMFNAVVGFYLE